MLLVRIQPGPLYRGFIALLAQLVDAPDLKSGVVGSGPTQGIGWHIGQKCS